MTNFIWRATSISRLEKKKTHKEIEREREREKEHKENRKYTIRYLS